MLFRSESGRAEKGEKKGEAENQTDCAASLPKSSGCCILDAGDLGPLCPLQAQKPNPAQTTCCVFTLPLDSVCVCMCVCVCVCVEA